MHLTVDPIKIVWNQNLFVSGKPEQLRVSILESPIAIPVILPKQNLGTNPHLKTSVWSKLSQPFLVLGLPHKDLLPFQSTSDIK